jgi:hypothetical protein
MTTIKALKNFGHLGKAIPAGTTLEVDPDSFGGTYEDFIKAGVFEKVGGVNQPVEPAPTAVPSPMPAPQPAMPKSPRETVVIKGEGGSIETIHPGSEVNAPS